VRAGSGSKGPNSQDKARGLPEQDNALALPAGTKLRDFQIDRMLGHGGFGITYLARDTRDGESVAIKEYLPIDIAVRVGDATIKARTSDDVQNFQRGIRQFLDEGRRVARLSHPSIMEVKEFFLLNGTGYIVFRYEMGPTLKERLARGLLPEGSLRAVLRGLLDGLAVVHAQGLLHRDIKPSNIILSRSRSKTAEVAVLIDFGAAREYSSRPGREMTALITPGYSPNEQYRRGKQGPPSDLYALGATAYRCIAGEPPPEARLRSERDTMVPAVERGRGAYSVELLRLIDRMLSMDETDRPGSAVEALAAVDALPAQKARSSSAQAAGSFAPATSAKTRETTMHGERYAGGQGVTRDIEVHGEGAKQVVFVLPKPEKVDFLLLALRVTPPGQFLAEKSGFRDTPHYFAFDYVEGDRKVVGFRSRADLQSRIERGADVEISSNDAVIGQATWPLGRDPRAPIIDSGKIRAAWIALLVLLLTGFAAAAMNIARLQDALCANAGFCTVPQLAFREAEACIQRSPACSVDACAASMRNANSPRLAARYTELEGRAKNACRTEDTAAFTEANACARQAAPCDAGRCFTTYLTRYPNGTSAAQAREAEAQARQACTAATAQPAAKKGGPATRGQQPAAPPPPQIALPDGVYAAERRFTGPKSRTDERNCPPLQRLRVTVSGDKLSFEVTEGATQTPRKWNGTILDPVSGTISFLGHKAEPEMITRYTILGDYNAAIVDSMLCGAGVFKIIK
jgi:hypothetical protein